VSKFKTHHERRKAILEGSEKPAESKAVKEVVEAAQEVESAPEASEELIGDVNGDGKVDEEDLAIVTEAVEASEDKGEL